MGKHARIVLFSFLLVAIFILSAPLAKSQVEVTRTPSSAQASPGQTLDFALSVSVSGLQEGIIITESLPSGWSVSGSSPPIDKKTGNEIKWIFTSKAGVSGKEITYSLKAPDSQGSHQLAGEWKSIDTDGKNFSGPIESTTIEVSSPPGSDGDSGSGSGSGSGGGSGHPPKEETPDDVNSSICPPGAKKCSGNKLLSCTGTGWILEKTCPACESGICLEPETPEKNKSEQEPETLPQEKPIDLTGRFIYENMPLLGGIVFILISVIVALKILLKPRRKKPPEEKFRYEFHPPERN